MKYLIEFINKDIALKSQLRLIKNSIHWMIENYLKRIEDLNIQEWNEIHFWLQNHQKNKSHGKSFQKYYIKTKNYANIWMQLILFYWKIFKLKNNDIEFLLK